MTELLGRSARGEAPTRAIVRASARICSGVRATLDVQQNGAPRRGRLRPSRGL